MFNMCMYLKCVLQATTHIVYNTLCTVLEILQFITSSLSIPKLVKLESLFVHFFITDGKLIPLSHLYYF